jgi:UDP-3-O-[3-hydroxymyristoyl] glucosamine N-acyltransferase
VIYKRVSVLKLVVPFKTIMKTFFKKKGPFDINVLLKKTYYTEEIKLKKTLVKNISILKNAKKSDITFLENKKYINDLILTKASFCLIKEKFLNDIRLKNIVFLIIHLYQTVLFF